MIRKAFVLPVILPLLALGGCSGLLSLASSGGAIGQAQNLAGQVENFVPELILQKYQALHNLKVGMEAIDAAPGPVTMTMPAPVVTPSP